MITLTLPFNGKKAQCDCLAATAYSVISNLGKNYINVFALFFGFEYCPNPKMPFDECFDRGGLIHTSDYNLSKITGVEIQHQINTGTLDDMKSIIKKYTQNGRPVAIQLDAFNCPWNIAYQKVHFNHYILTLGYKDEILLCQDPFCYINNIELDPKIQSYIGRDYYIYNICEKKDMLPEEQKMILKEAVQYYIMTQTHNKILQFASDLIGQTDYFFNIQLQNPVIINPFFIKLKSLVSDRLNFLLFLEDISAVMPDQFTALVNDFRKITKLWQDTYLLMIKTMMREINSNELEPIEQRFVQLANDEYYIAAEIINLLII